ncbi:MAG: tRNA (guanosine(37)-N1)-methyltransferase TrmD [Longimicrobiales bacterium]|nr:tRNA (guanosine(37)-N1)-methyltransferase TrmD [Longimicrobiales bacterium]
MPTLRINIVTIFPDFFRVPLETSIPGRAAEDGLVEYRVVDLRDYTHDRHQTVDDYPYGGGAGMVMKPEPFFEAVDDLRSTDPDGSPDSRDSTFDADGTGPPPGRTPATERPAQSRGSAGRILLLSARGKPFRHQDAVRLSLEGELTLLCGHYKDVDQRVGDHLAHEEISVGDFVLSGGEVAALAVTDAIVRLLPGALGDHASAASDSFYEGPWLSPPSYTRPAEYRGHAVPEVLLSGDHARIAEWRRQQAERLTRERRPDLLERSSEGDSEPGHGE